MEALSINNPQLNFWECYPDLIFPPEFNSIYKKDKTQKKEESSRIMWGIYLAFSPRSSYKNLPLNQKEDILIKEIIKDKKFKFSDYTGAIVLFESMVLTPAKRYLQDWEKMLSERKVFYNSIPYDVETWKMKDEMMKNNKALFDDYKKIQQELEKEGDGAIVKGQGEESASEKDLI